MANRHTQVRADSASGNSVQLTSQETDSPILPVAHLQQLHTFRPDLVDWICQQTEAEAQHRRVREQRVDAFIFAERIGGLVCGAFIAAFGLGVAAYVGLNGQAELAAVLGGGTLVGIVTVLVTGKRGQRPTPTADSPKQAQPRAAKK